jgi:hypothetical protein
MATDKDERIGATAASSDVNGPLSLSLSRQSVAVEDIEYTGAQLGKVPTGVCLKK